MRQRVLMSTSSTTRATPRRTGLLLDERPAEGSDGHDWTTARSTASGSATPPASWSTSTAFDPGQAGHHPGSMAEWI
jgi:hypothetical protein